MTSPDFKKDISVIIVNYNVKHFLEQTIRSVQKAVKNLNVEIIVVDNNSVDGSVNMLRTHFPDVKLIDNQENKGFSRANNQGIREAEGKYVLLLNPDTVVEENTFTKCFRFMEEHPEAGGLGVKMIDGKGNFLPESKRSFPSPGVAFHKVFGLAKLFPRSRTFGKYHLGYLDQDQIHEVDVLSGAFMFLRKEAIEQTGDLDEDYFMYGEDIDLSYRIKQAGYKNYYFPETNIIHYKGESTKKTSFNYVFVFYKAMIIFAQKHFSHKNAGMFSFLINIAIIFRAFLSIFYQVAKKSILPLADATLISAGFWGIYHYMPQYFPEIPIYEGYMSSAVPVYILIWILSLIFSGGYNPPFRIWPLLSGTLIGTLIISALSNFLNTFDSPSSLLLSGVIWTFISTTFIRGIYNYFRYGYIFPAGHSQKKIAVVGNKQESHRVINLLKDSLKSARITGYISINEAPGQEDSLGNIDQIREIISIYDIDEVVFCSKDITASQIINWMTLIDRKFTDFKIAPDNSNYVIGSNSAKGPGNFYTVNINLALLQNKNIRSKRILDIITGILFLLLSPFLVWYYPHPSIFLKNCVLVLIGEFTWVSLSEHHLHRFPKVKKGVITPVSHLKIRDNQKIYQYNMEYARYYHVGKDLGLIFKSFKQLGAAA